MKITTTFRSLAITIAMVSTTALAQEIVTQTTTSGTITRFTPEAIIVDSGTSPVTYTATSSTQYVDEAGTPVGVEVVKSGLPVVVHYVNEGGTMVARKVIVKKTVTTSVPGSTTMTTVQPVEVTGTVSQINPNAVVVRSSTGTPVTYAYTSATQYVDAAGNPVTVETVRSGAPVTVSYVQEGDRMIARRVVVRTTEVAPAATVKKTVTTTTTKSTDDDDDDDDKD